MFTRSAASSVAPRGESMQARSCNPVADLVQPADGASEYNIAPAHGGIAILVKRVTAPRPSVHRSAFKSMLADGAKSTASRVNGWGR
eukprot:5498506-Lingulodinium_polyedra.AAC.1